MKIEVIPSEIGENCRVKRHSMHASNCQRVRRNFHCDMRAAGLFQLVKQAVEVQRFGRRIHGRQPLRPKAILDGPHQSGGPAG